MSQKFTVGNRLQRRLINHRDSKKVMDHFVDLSVADAMVWRPIWFAYRPQTTPAERSASPSFARHAVAHAASGRQMNRRNAVQAAMLVASLIDLATLRQDHVARIQIAA